VISNHSARVEYFYFLVVIDDGDGFADVIVGFVDVMEDAHLEAARFGIVFFLAAIVASVIEQFLRLVQTAYPRKMRIDGCVIVDIFSVVDGGVLNFGDSVINPVDGISLLFFQFAAVGPFQQAARKAEIGERVQVCGMLSLCVRLIR
jgi:hypothetical protein